MHYSKLNGAELSRPFVALLLLVLAACSDEAEPILCQTIDMRDPVAVPAGTLSLGGGAIYPEEQRRGEIAVTDFWLDPTEVTNQDFARFVTATGYVTQAEQAPDRLLHPDLDPADALPGSAVFTQIGPEQGLVWTFIPGANWRAPKGPGSDIAGKMHHPVVHVSYKDARAYALWAGGRLPSEAEWEYAARSGLVSATYEWGNEAPGQLATPIANVWQGLFPLVDLAEDGFAGSSPVGCYPANAYGLFDMTGNVWEWVESPDSLGNVGIIKGGSHLCAENFCRRFRPAARQPHERDFSTTHIGFRVAYDGIVRQK